MLYKVIFVRHTCLPLAKPMATTEALDLLLQGQSIEDVVLLDLETQKLGMLDRGL